MEFFLIAILLIALVYFASTDEEEDDEFEEEHRSGEEHRREELEWIYIKEVSAYDLMNKVNFNQWLNQFKFILQNSDFITNSSNRIINNDSIHQVETKFRRERGLSYIDYSMWYSDHFPKYEAILYLYSDNVWQDTDKPNFYFNCLTETQAFNQAKQGLQNAPAATPEEIVKFENQIRELKKQKEQVVTIGEGIKIEKQISKLEGKIREKKLQTIH